MTTYTTSNRQRYNNDEVEEKWSLSNDGEEGGEFAFKEEELAPLPSITASYDVEFDKDKQTVDTNKIENHFKLKCSVNPFLLTFNSPEVEIKYHRFIAMQSSLMSGGVMLAIPSVVILMAIFNKLPVYVNSSDKMASVAGVVLVIYGIFSASLTTYAIYFNRSLSNDRARFFVLDLKSLGNPKVSSIHPLGDDSMFVEDKMPYSNVPTKKKIYIKTTLEYCQDLFSSFFYSSPPSVSASLPISPTDTELEDLDVKVKKAMRISFLATFSMVVLLDAAVWFRVIFIVGGGFGLGSIFQLPLVPVFVAFYAPLHISLGFPILFTQFLFLQIFSFCAIVVAYRLNNITACDFGDSATNTSVYSIASITFFLSVYFYTCWYGFRKNITNFYNREILGLAIAQLSKEENERFAMALVEDYHQLHVF